MGSSEDPSLINNVDELGLVYEGLSSALDQRTSLMISAMSARREARRSGNNANLGIRDAKALLTARSSFVTAVRTQLW